MSFNKKSLSKLGHTRYSIREKNYEDRVTPVFELKKRRQDKRYFPQLEEILEAYEGAAKRLIFY